MVRRLPYPIPTLKWNTNRISTFNFLIRKFLNWLHKLHDTTTMTTNLKSANNIPWNEKDSYLQAPCGRMNGVSLSESECRTHLQIMETLSYVGSVLDAQSNILHFVLQPCPTSTLPTTFHWVVKLSITSLLLSTLICLVQICHIKTSVHKWATRYYRRTSLASTRSNLLARIRCTNLKTAVR